MRFSSIAFSALYVANTDLFGIEILALGVFAVVHSDVPTILIMKFS
ncbi:hypothetical protein SLEP1_g38409 [Rubroshorea leprosula]|nr:hypothetical protein SLEP1_g38409 [Rubroshorea leprosula]